MADTKHLYARDARDRLIDLLGLGLTDPLRDVPVREDNLTVPFDGTAKIAIEASQPGVLYQLYDYHDDEPVMRDEGGQMVPAEAWGNGETLFIETPRVRDDVTYSIRARKTASRPPVYVQQRATVKVGLDRALRARILDAPLLDPSVEAPSDSAPRLAAYGAELEVQIDRSQEGVDYRLVVEEAGGVERPVSASVRGNRDDITLRAEPAKEDVDLRVRATKTFDPAENRPTETELLDAVLPLKVRARLDLGVTVEPSPIVSFDQGTTIWVTNTQLSASYQLYARLAGDDEFIFGAGAPDALTVDVEGAERVQVKRPPRYPVWQDIEGFAPLGEPAPGKGGKLGLPTGALEHDTVLLVRAQKTHQGPVNLPSAVQLDQAALVLVRPDTSPGLSLITTLEGDQTDGTIEVRGGQPGVFYALRLEPGGADLGPPAYVHKRDGGTPPQNKGLGQLRLEVDFVVSRGTTQPATSPAELASTPPMPALVETGPLDLSAPLYVRALKAQTRVAAPDVVPIDVTIAPEP